jgi:FixJ family two-component response regulator
VFTSAEEFLARPRATVPGCLVLDYRLPHLDGLALQRQLVVNEPHLPIIFISYYGDAPMVVQAMKAGALEILGKPFRDDELLTAIEQGVTRSHSALIRQGELQRLRLCYATLTRREQQTMWLVIAGRSNKRIAGELNISEITVKAHRGRVMAKMKARSLAELVTLATRLKPELLPGSSD